MVLFFFGGSVFARRAKTEPPKGKKFVVCVRPIFFKAKKNRQRVRKLWYAYVPFSPGRKRTSKGKESCGTRTSYFLLLSVVFASPGEKTTDKQ